MRRKNTRPTHIYWLFDISPKAIVESGWTCGVPFYCGKTVKSPAKRLTDHKRLARQQPEYARNRLSVKRLAECGRYVRVDVMEIISPNGDWIEAEKRWIQVLRFLNPDCANIADGGSGVPGIILSPESIARIRAANLGRKLTPEHIELLRLANTGKRHTPDSIARMCAAKKGCKGFPLSDAHRAALLAANTGRQMPEKTRRQISGSVKKSWDVRHVQLPDPEIVKRNILVYQMRAEGHSLSAIGVRIGLTKQRVWQLLNLTEEDAA